MARYTFPEFPHCDRCPEPAGQLVKINNTETALCFSCWHPYRSTGSGGDGTAVVIHWINKYGRIMFAPGATTGPFKINHP